MGRSVAGVRSADHVGCRIPGHAVAWRAIGDARLIVFVAVTTGEFIPPLLDRGLEVTRQRRQVDLRGTGVLSAAGHSLERERGLLIGAVGGERGLVRRLS